MPSWKAKAVPGSPSLSLFHSLECCPLAIAVNARVLSLSLSSCWRRPKSPTHKLHSTHSELHSRRIALTVNQARARKKEREREWESRQELHSRRITLITDYPVRAYTRGSGRAREMRTSAVCTVKGQVRAGQHNRAMLSEVKQRRLVELPLL